jgi:hypothetical protein
MSLEENIKKWVEYDSTIKRYNELIRSTRESKRLLENRIHNDISSYSKKPVINISDGVLKFTKLHVQQPLSYKLIENSLSRIINDKHQIESIIDVIKNNRESKEQNVIKRYYR